MNFYSKISVQAIVVVCIALLGACRGSGDPPVSPAAVAPMPIPDMPPIPAPDVPVPAPDVTPPTPASDATPAKVSTARFVSTAPVVKDGNYGASAGLTYDFGRLMVKSGKPPGSQPSVHVTRIAGWVRYPQAAAQTSGSTKYPVIVFLHGMHGWGVDSFKGYDYLSESLVTNGYVVISIDANGINASQALTSVYNSVSRAQLVLKTLDRLFADGKSANPLYPELAGKLDPDRIGIMGHSRGGEGVAEVVAMNGRRDGVTLKEVRESAVYLNEDVAANGSVLAGFQKNNPMGLTEQRASAAITWNTESEIAAAVKLAGTEPVYPGLPMKLRDDGADTAGISDVVFAQELRAAGIELAPGQADPATPPTYTFKAILALAPTDTVNVAALSNVPMATLIPTCDGDVWTYDGARMYDTNRFGIQGNVVPRYQLTSRGTNHNWFNTTWTYDTPEIPALDVPTQDDANPANKNDLYCQIQSNAPDASAATPKESIRLSAADQRKMGIFLMNSFMRFFVGGEKRFGAYWTGASQIPADSCPAGTATCDERVVLTAQRPRGERTRVTRFDLFQPSTKPNTVLNPNGSTSSYSGMTDAVDCDSFYSTRPHQCWPVVTGSRTQSILTVGDRGASRYDDVSLFSPADHMQLAWNAPGASIVTDLAGMSVAGRDTLTFRIANVDRAAQEVEVMLSDGVHPAVMLKVSAYSDALYTQGAQPPTPLPATMTTNRMLLNMVSIPLAAFEGVDPARLKTLTLNFPHASGIVALTDLQFQNLDRKSAQAATSE